MAKRPGDLLEVIMVRPAVPIELSAEERDALESWLREPTLEHRRVEQAHIILALAAGLSNKEVAQRLDIEALKVCRWRHCFAQQRLAGLADAKRSGRPPQYRRRERLAIGKAARQPPATTSHWSVRQLAQQLHQQVGISKSQLQKVLREMDLQPHRLEMWLNSQDPDFEAKQTAIIGLYLHTPRNALVLSVDEKTSSQALDRQHPSRAMRPGSPEKKELEYVRRGTRSLFAALWVARPSPLRGRIRAKS